jgi:hypothetical protein
MRYFLSFHSPLLYPIQDFLYSRMELCHLIKYNISFQDPRIENSFHIIQHSTCYYTYSCIRWRMDGISLFINVYIVPYKHSKLVFICKSWLHRKKRFATFSSPAWMSLTELSLGKNNLIIPAQGEFGTGMSLTFFYSVVYM